MSKDNKVFAISIIAFVILTIYWYLLLTELKLMNDIPEEVCIEGCI